MQTAHKQKLRTIFQKETHILWLFLSLYSFAPAQTLNSFKPFASGDSIYRYDGSARIFKAEIQGSLIIRRLGTDHFRLAFFNERSLTFFDLEVHPNRKLSYQFLTPKMKNPVFLSVLRKYLFTLLLTGPDESGEKGKHGEWVFRKNRFSVAEDSTHQVTEYYWKKRKTEVRVSDWKDQAPGTFTIRSKGFPLVLDFKKYTE